MENSRGIKEGSYKKGRMNENVWEDINIGVRHFIHAFNRSDIYKLDI